MGVEQLFKRLSEISGVNIDSISVLHSQNLLDYRNTLRILILDEYYKEIKIQDQSFTEIKINLSAKYSVSIDFVNNSLYKYSYLYNPFL